VNPSTTTHPHPIDAAALREALRALAAALPIVILFNALRGRAGR